MHKERKRPDTFYGYLEGWLSLILNLILFGLKYWAGVVSGSVALIADAWHTLSDSLTSVIVLIGFKVSSKPPDKDHPFGHGRAELIGAVIIGAILAIVGFNFLIESIIKLQDHETGNFGAIAIIVTAVSIVLKEGLAQFAIRAGKKIGSRSLIADGWHHRSDAISSVLILIGIFLGDEFWWMDGVLGILVSALIFYTAYELLKETISPLIGEKPDSEMVEKLQEMAREVCHRDLHIHHVHVHEYGNHTEMTFHIQLPGNTSLNDAHDIATLLEKNIREHMNIEATIHMEPMDIKTMNIETISFYRKDDPESYEHCLNIRKEVFVDEQKVDLNIEVDQYEDVCKYYLIKLDKNPAATGRWHETEEGYKLERFAVLDKYRATGLGRIILEAVLTDVLPTDKPVYLNSQTVAAGFYEKYGFRKVGEPFFEANIEHYKMVLDI